MAWEGFPHFIGVVFFFPFVFVVNQMELSECMCLGVGQGHPEPLGPCPTPAILRSNVGMA